MSDIAIRVEQLGKRYYLGERERYYALRDVLANAVKAPFRRSAPRRPSFWALRDISFEVRRGDVVGVIGRNGAGKSTLLKLITRITDPTEGRIALWGRVASLLEVGTGFHPELTGRENIYMNGAILGMGKREIERKFDEIVAFAEIEKFLDTPVKRFSSGMYVRLAFAVAAHLEPEILLVDEVLAVGDAAFQQKCLGKMGEVAKSGRTILFVSHNMAAVQALCTSGVYLTQGEVSFLGPIEEALHQYLSSLEQQRGELQQAAERRGQGRTRVTGIDVRCPRYAGDGQLMVGEAAEFTFHLSHPLPRLTCIFTVYNELGLPVATFHSDNHAPNDVYTEQPADTFTCALREVTLLPGRYRINLAVNSAGDLEDHVEGGAFFQVHPGLLDGRAEQGSTAYGVIAMPHQWIAR